MVIRDLSFSETRPTARGPSFLSPAEFPLAPVTDRFLALILDFLIFSPVVSFFIAGVLRNLKIVLLLNSESEEAMVIWALFLIGIVGVSSLLEALFMYFWQATPGQKFMQLQVVSYPQKNPGERLSLAQCLVRSLGWWLCLLMLGVAFLEILGHPLRRALHERASDTMVISHKREAPDFPLAIETHYIRSTLWAFYSCMFFVSLVFIGKTYRTAVREGLNGKTATVAKEGCASLSDEKYNGPKRLDLALALYLANEADETCVFNEAQNAVWAPVGEERSLGQLALALVSEDEKEAAAYRDKVCEEDAKSEACAISHYLHSQDEDRGDVLRRGGGELVSTKILLLKNSLDLKSYIAAAGLIKELEGESPLRSFLDISWMRVGWGLNTKGSRQPASVEEKNILKSFKERYSLE
ncbi:MAG: RDD family protein [Pseudobdellovibrionaceae bacterium]